MVETSNTKIKKSKKINSNKPYFIWIGLLLLIIVLLLVLIAYIVGKQSNAIKTNSQKQEISQKKKSKEIKNIKNDANQTEKKEFGSIQKEKLIEKSKEKSKNDSKKEEQNNVKKIVLDGNNLKWDESAKKIKKEDTGILYHLADITEGKFNKGTLNEFKDITIENDNFYYIELNNSVFVVSFEDGGDVDYYKQIFGDNKDIKIVYNIEIPQLNFENELSFNYKGREVYAVKYGFFYIDELPLFEKYKKYLKKLDYIDPLYGQVWTTDYSKKMDEVNIASMGGIYFVDPAGVLHAYRLVPSIVAHKPKLEDANIEDALDIIWNDTGKKNKIKYEYSPQGCGMRSFVVGSNLPGYDDIKEDDLKEIGKTSGGISVYGFKSMDNKILKDTYKIYQSLKETSWIEESMQEQFGKKSINSLEEFYKLNPVIVFKDALGRYQVMTASVFREPVECGKPVIYLYPQKEMNVSVKVLPTGGFTKVEPDYPDSGWFVSAKPNGQLYNFSDGKTYPYLFWEGKSDVLYNQPQKGFVVKRNELGELFDKTLSAQNLNKQEIDDFKEFWIPKMLKSDKPYFFVTYTSRKFIDRAAPLVISPKPDTVIRVMMDYEPLKNYKEVEKMTFNPIERKGFTVVEWGGMLGK